MRGCQTSLTPLQLQSNIPWHICLTILFYLLNFIYKNFVRTQLGVTHFYLIYISIYDFASAAANTNNAQRIPYKGELKQLKVLFSNYSLHKYLLYTYLMYLCGLLIRQY